MKSKQSLVALLLLAGIVSPAIGKNKKAPLPEKIVTAKTIFIKCKDAEIKDKAYTQLTKWGRYVVVDSADKADLVMVVETSTHLSGFTSHTQKGYDFSHGGSNSQIATAPDRTTTDADYSGTTSIDIIDAKTGESLWADSKPWRAFHSATKDVIKELQERLDKQAGTKK